MFENEMKIIAEIRKAFQSLKEQGFSDVDIAMGMNGYSFGVLKSLAPEKIQTAIQMAVIMNKAMPSKDIAADATIN